MNRTPRFRPSTAHASLGEAFYDVVEPARFQAVTIRFRNQRWAARVGLDSLSDDEWIDHFARFAPLPGSFPKPLALRYHGHQFGTYNPELGDGRGFLFAQLQDDRGRLLDLGTKGSGQTPWSRNGDGRLTLRGGVREVLATEMLDALGVNTSKTFSLIETGEALTRYDEPPPIDGAVLVRLNHSHIRIGSFQRLLYLEQHDEIGRLLDHAITTYMPSAWSADRNTRAVRFLRQVCGNVARVGAQWMVAGFVHGVLNTDNINVTGESFDYGPWRFLPTYDPPFTAAYFDETRRYAYGRQPSVLQWNLTRLAECLLPLATQADLEDALSTYGTALNEAFVRETLRRLGFVPSDPARDSAFVDAFWGFMNEARPPFEPVFFDWYGGLASAARAEASPTAALYQRADFAAVRDLFAGLHPLPGLDLGHPYFGQPAPCTMLIEEVDAILTAITQDKDWAPFEAKITAIRAMGAAYGTVSPAG